MLVREPVAIEQRHGDRQRLLRLVDASRAGEREPKVELRRCVLDGVPRRRVALKTLLKRRDHLRRRYHDRILLDVDVLVVSVGNVLGGDDGFGVVVAHRLQAASPPPGVRVLEIGIGGIDLVHELLEPARAVIVVDAVDLGRAPGTVLVQHPDIKDVYALTPQQRLDELADMHYATPDRALMLAAALGVLPETVWLVGCQPRDSDRLGEGLSPPVAAAVEPAAAEVRRLAREAGTDWP
jgi:hydrogenase maturation protease